MVRDRDDRCRKSGTSRRGYDQDAARTRPQQVILLFYCTSVCIPGSHESYVAHGQCRDGLVRHGKDLFSEGRYSFRKSTR